MLSTVNISNYNFNGYGAREDFKKFKTYVGKMFRNNFTFNKY